jgi:hypothetical protein
MDVATPYETLVIGAGPVGLYFATLSPDKCLILEKRKRYMDRDYIVWIDEPNRISTGLDVIPIDKAPSKWNPCDIITRGVSKPDGGILQLKNVQEQLLMRLDGDSIVAGVGVNVEKLLTTTYNGIRTVVYACGSPKSGEQSHQYAATLTIKCTSPVEVIRDMLYYRNSTRYFNINDIYYFGVRLSREEYKAVMLREMGLRNIIFKRIPPIKKETTRIHRVTVGNSNSTYGHWSLAAKSVGGIPIYTIGDSVQSVDFFSGSGLNRGFAGARKVSELLS